MKLVTFTIMVNDWRDMNASDENIDRMLDEVQYAVGTAIDKVSERYNVVLKVNED